MAQRRSADGTYLASPGDIKREHLDGMIEDFQAGDPTPIYVSNSNEPEAVFVPYVVVERLRAYEQAAQANGDDSALSIYPPKEFDRLFDETDPTPANIEFTRRMSEKFINKQLDRFASGDHEPVYLIVDEPEAALIPIWLFDRFLEHEKNAELADMQMLSERVADVDKLIAARARGEDVEDFTFDDYFETLDERAKAVVRQALAEDD